MLRHLFFLILVLSLNTTYAKEVFPDNCVPFVLDKESELTMLNVTPPQIVMLHNLTDNDLWVVHPVKEPSASAGWSTKIHSDKWSALMLATNQFGLTCIESLPGHEQQVQCAEVLAICTHQIISNIDIEKFTTTYFIAENLGLKEMMSYIGRQGFIMN